MKVMVTGGAGFIGSHLVDACLAAGDEVVVLDDLSVGRLSNLQSAFSSPRFRFVQARIEALGDSVNEFAGCDVVYHLAARADIVPSIQMPEVYFQANVDGTFAVLQAAKQAGVKRFIYAASSSCYGLPDIFPTPETAAIRTEYPYALTKYLGEQLVLHWGKVYRLPVVSLRFFNVFGPRVRTTGTYGAVFGVFLAQKLKGVPLTVVGDGTQTRDFTYVSDVVAALQAAAASEVTNEVFNVGSGGTYSINQLVQLLEGEVVYIPKRPGEPDCTFAHIEKIQTRLQWRPTVSFAAGVGKMLENLADWNEAPLWTPESIAIATEDWFRYLTPSAGGSVSAQSDQSGGG